jgi:beta-lactamase regulating signal transducer with metallopeptidase domain
MNNPLLAILVNHLWQSTLFVVVIWCLARLLRKNSARVRYMLWLAASLKFLLPFAVLAALGTLLPWHAEPGRADVETPLVVSIAGDLTAPMAGDLQFPRRTNSTAPGSPSFVDLVTMAALVLWLIGALLVAARWLVRWVRIQRTLWQATPLTGIDFPAPVRVTAKQVEPGVVGILWPRLLLPTGIAERLTPTQMRAVLAHERCHLRRRDNLTASLHMLVEVLFWFFPPVWWIGNKLIEERENACDEQVVREGHAPDSYAEGILNVCEHYIASRLPCVSGVSGADLKQRVQSIIRCTLGARLDRRRKALLAATACCAVAAPLAAGMFSGGTAIQILASLGPSGAAFSESIRVMQAHTDTITPVARASSHSNTCPEAASPELTQRQKGLARIVAKLSPKDRDALYYAVVANSTPDVQRLLAGGATWKAGGFLMSESLMSVAARYSDRQMLETLASGGFAIDSWSAPLNAGDSSSLAKTPLMIAVETGRKDNAYWLLEHGADATAINQKSGHSPLLLAVLLCRDKNLIAQLLGAGAKPDARTLRVADNVGIDLRTNPATPGPPLQSWREPAEGTQVSVDFDGDSKPDQAVLRLSIDGKWEALFVSMTHAPDTWIKAAEAKTLPPHDAVHMQMSLVRPGTYATACSKGYGRPCQRGEPLAITLKSAGIRYSEPEGASSIFYWDEAAQALKRVWISD